MLAEPPAGGGGTCLCSPPAPSSAPKEATDGVRRFRLQSQRCCFSLSRALFLPGRWGGALGSTPHRHEGQSLTERGSPPSPVPTTNSLLPPHGRLQQLRDEARHQLDPPPSPLKVALTALKSSDPVPVWEGPHLGHVLHVDVEGRRSRSCHMMHACGCNGG